MKDRSLEIQVLYEVAMSIGNELNMSDMLQNSLNVILRNLNCSAGVVLESQESDHNTYTINPIFSIPRNIDQLSAYRTAIGKFPDVPNSNNLIRMTEQFPIVEAVENRFFFHILELPDFGFLILIKANKPLETQLLHSLKPINTKLARSCLACGQNEAMNQMIERLRIENEERRKAEDALIKSHELFQTLMDSIDATIYVADMERYEILFLNKYMQEHFGDKLEGETCYKVFRNESKPCEHCSNSKLIDQNGKPTGVYSWEGRNPLTGKVFINYDRAIKWTDGQYVRLQIATDVTKMKEMEEKLRQSHKMEAIGTLAGGIAHDFNNILGIIVGNTELAIQDVPDWNPAKFNLEEIRTACLRAKDVVRQLLSYSRKTEQSKKPINIHPIIKEGIQLLRSSIPASIDIHADIPNSLSVIKADPTQIHQVLINLCTNASHAMEVDAGVLKISIKEIDLDENSCKRYQRLKPGSYIQLMVSDNGNGIDPEILEKIFDPYFTTKEVNKGTGMGLAVVLGIVKGHDGEVLVESELGKGTQVKVMFPIIYEEAEPETKTAKRLPAGTERILLIDDEASILKIGKLVLERLGYSVETKDNPAEALELFRLDPNQFDLVITDMTMPQILGDQLAKEMLQLRNDIPIILCTGYNEKIDGSNALDIGVRKYVEKPLDTQKLAIAVRRAIDKE